ncbi:MAG: alpha-(1-_3)-arabinofuranosyltransferase domain-containing protein [Ilumatobacteraceae bacterium]
MTVRRFAPTAPFVLLAYLPALLSSPGRMPADSKLYLYFDPGGFFADAAGSFDPGQFTGWVPHQHIAHLWPSLPWFWSFDLIGVPDWIAHRLWIGTLFLAAGLGVRRSARSLGLVGHGCLVAGLIYQTTPFVLPYVSRTSVMLLPWAGLGWILAFTIAATRRGTWAAVAPIALVVVTVGAVNATALLLLVPAPLAWLAHEVARHDLSVRAATTVAVRTGLLCLGVSAWWMSALVIQGRWGAEVLPYSETLADVSAASTSAEVWRGLGYWLFYVRDAFAPTTTAATPFLSSSAVIALSFLVPVLCLAGLVWVRWVHRRFAAALVAVGGVLSVGVHPIDDRSPLALLLSGGGDDGLVLALRSSTRALPVMVLGLSLAAGSFVVSFRAPRPRRVVAWSYVGAATLGLPALWTASLVDPALERDQDPPRAWLDAASSLDDRTRRVLMLPGAEFGAYRWGYTVDQPLPGLTDVPVVTRDLLPLGSPAAMDLLYALDDRFQDGVAEPASVAPIARLLGVGTIWLTNDAAFERFRTARPEVVRDVVLSASASDAPIAFGEPVVNRPDVEVVDEAFLVDDRIGAALPPVELVALDEPGGVIRVRGRSLLVAGSGDGLVDAAAAGLVPPDVLVRYTADGVDADPSAVGIIVTDSHRDRARHWRTSQDTTGYTESGAAGAELLREPIGDARLPVFDNDDPSSRTTAIQAGPVTATATSYGEPFAYTPEHRPSMAIDGDPDTGWLVGQHGDPVGASIRLTIAGDAPDGSIRLVQWPSGERRIVAVEMTSTDVGSEVSERRRIDLDERSLQPEGQTVPLVEGGVLAAVDVDQVELAIVTVGGAGPDPVGFTEIDLGLGPTLEVVRVPVPDVSATLPTARVFSRLRTDPLDRWRSDPEVSLVRSWTEPTSREVSASYTVRLDARSSDADLAELFGWPATADRRLVGSLRSVGAAAFDRDGTTAWRSPFGEPGGTIRVEGVDETLESITIVQPRSGYSTIDEIELRSSGGTRRLSIEPDASGVATSIVDPPLVVVDDLEISVTSVVEATTVDRRFGDVVVLPVAITEIEFRGAPSVVALSDSSVVVECAPIGDLDGTQLAATPPGARPEWLDGAPLEAAPCHERLMLAAGDHLLAGSDGPFVLDRVVLDDGLAEALGRPTPEITGEVVTIDRNRFGGRFRVECRAACWFVFGEGFNRGWSAEVAGEDAGPPMLVDGGFNGWLLAPGTSEIVVSWPPQRYQTAALVVSAATTLGALALIIRRRRGDDQDDSTAPDDEPPRLALEVSPSARSAAFVVMAWAVPAGVIAGPGWGVAAGAVGIIAHRCRSLPLAALAAMCTVATVGLGVVALEIRRSPAHDLGWPGAFEPLHGFGMVAFALLVTSVVLDADAGAQPSGRRRNTERGR